MKTAVIVIVLLILVVVLVVVFFQSSHYLRRKLYSLEEDLEQLPATKESYTLIAEIGHLVGNYSDPEWKRKSRILIRKTNDFIQKNVPCYGESREILTFEQREYSTKCEKCNGKYHCVFHKEWLELTGFGWLFFNL